MKPSVSETAGPRPSCLVGLGPRTCLRGLSRARCSSLQACVSDAPSCPMAEREPGALAPPAPGLRAVSTCSPRCSSACPLYPSHHGPGGAARTYPHTSRSPASCLWKGGTVDGAQETEHECRGPQSRVLMAGAGARTQAGFPARPEERPWTGQARPYVHSFPQRQGAGRVVSLGVLGRCGHSATGPCAEGGTRTAHALCLSRVSDSTGWLLREFAGQ